MRLSAKEISRLLAGNVEDVCHLLLPNGKRSGKEWRVGSLAGDEGQSLGVSLANDKAGLWCDFATGESGDLLDLWMKVKDCSLVDAMTQAAKLLNVPLEKYGFAGSARKYDQPAKVKCSTPKNETPVVRYLLDRGLTLETLNLFRVGDGGDSIIFPFFHCDEVKMVKRLMLERKGDKKDIRPTSGNQMPCLFGWQAVDPKARSVTICEGEIDAMSLKQIGVDALSVPFGGGGGSKQDWIENEYDNLAVFDTIYLCLDDDEEGKKATVEIAGRLGRHRCQVVKLGHKDANEALLAGMDVFDLVTRLNESVSLDPAELRQASSFEDAVIREFYPPPGEPVGFVTPWRKVGVQLRFRPGEVTVLAGATGHGKSEGTGQLVLDAMAQGEKACVASLEFKPARWLAKITRQAAAVREPSIPFVRAVSRWLHDRLWVFDVTGTAKVSKILETFEYATRRYGVRLFVIDNLTKLDIATDDYNTQREFVDRLTDFAKEHNAHVLLVAHVRKGFDDTKPSGRFDIKGAGAITDLADNVLIWWRNRPKEDQLRKAGDEAPEALLDKADAVVRTEKQRNGEAEPVITLWFDQESHQFLGSRHESPRRYVEFTQTR